MKLLTILWLLCASSSAFAVCTPTFDILQGKLVCIDYSLDPTIATKPGANIWTGDNDFTAATKTAPIRKGAGAPAATCSPGEMYWNTSATTRESIYECTATNTWRQRGRDRVISTYSSGTPQGLTTTDTQIGNMSVSTTLEAGACLVVDVALDTVTGSNACTGSNVIWKLVIGGTVIPTGGITTSASSPSWHYFICNGAGVQNAQRIRYEGTTSSVTSAAINFATPQTVEFKGACSTAGTVNVTPYTWIVKRLVP